MGQGAVPRFVGIKARARCKARAAMPIEIEVSMETAPAVVWDAMVVPDGEAAAETLAPKSGHAIEFLKDQYRHCKPILLMGAATALLGKSWHTRGITLRRSKIPACFSSGA